MKTKILLLPVLLLSVCGSIIIGRKLFSALNEYKAGEEIYENISAAAYANTPEAASEAVISDIPQIEVREKLTTGMHEAESAASLIDFDALLEISPDIKGWIRLEGTKVDYPVAQSRDNDFYLNRAATG